MSENIAIAERNPAPIEISPVEIRKVADGDARAFERVYDAFSGRLYPLALRMLKRPEEAEDLLQEVFAKIWKDASSYDPRRGAPLAWALIMTRNKAIDRIRATTRRQQLRQNANEKGDNLSAGAAVRRPDEAAERSEEAEAVRGSISDLPSEAREAIELAYFGGLSQSQIAAKLSLPLTTVKGRIRRAMSHLRQSLGKFA